jgi:YHS domain-containing protein
MKLYVALFAFAMMIISCNQPTAENNSASDAKTTEMSAPEATKYSTDMVVNNKDYACGMPTSAGINDTCHYEGKAYGFCSSECKAEFQKDPAKYLASNK